MKPSQQHVVTCVKEVEWGLGSGHERFVNSGRVMGRHPGLLSLDRRGYTIGTPF